MPERSGEAQDAVVGGIDHIEISGGINGKSCGRGEAGGDGAAIGGRPLRKAADEIFLADDDVGFLSVGESGGAAKAEHAVVAGVADVETWGAGRGVERDALRGEEFAAFNQIRIGGAYLERRWLADHTCRLLVERDLGEGAGQQDEGEQKGGLK